MIRIVSIWHPSLPHRDNIDDFESVREPLNLKHQNGFTLIELCAVILILAMLAAVLLPALAGTRQSTQSFQCMNNQKQLILGWQMYAADNNGLLPPNDFPWLTAYRGSSAQTQYQMRNWVVGTMAKSLDASISSPPVIAEFTSSNTLLSPYVTNAIVYHCPADNYINPLTHNLNARSYSMNCAVGTIGYTFYTSGSPPLGSPVQGGWLPGNAYNANQTAWRTYGKMSAFTKPGPANTFVILDENPVSINDGRFQVSAFAAPGSTYLIDFPSGLHGAAGVISFADGHVVTHKWLDVRTYSPLLFAGSSQPLSNTPDDPDCFYLASIASAAR
jgi:prepilin-type N-terminal cleavage/methylation domain-containing protein